MLPITAPPPRISPFFHTHPNSRTLKISCTNGRNADQEMLAMEANLQIKKLHSQALDRDEAFKKSKEILFSELSNFAGLKSEDLRRKWRRMTEDERRGLARGFVAEWSAHLHPLSARSVKELVDEHLGQGIGFPDSDSMSARFMKFLGFNRNNNED